MPILRFIQDVYTDDAIDGRKMEAISDGVRDYVKSVLAKQVDLTINKDYYGEGTPRWAHVHQSLGDECHAATGEQTDCEYCHALSTDEANLPVAVTN